MKRRQHQKEIFFADSLQLDSAGGYTVHVFVQKGRLTFEMRDRNFIAKEGDYAILVEPTLCKNVTTSEDFKAVIVQLSSKYTLNSLIEGNMNVKSMMILLINPVLNLTEEDRKLCTEDLRLLHERIAITGHRLYKQVIDTIMAVHILDLHNIIIRQERYSRLSDKTAKIITNFMAMLHNGDYRKHRSLHHYASALFVADNYLTQICREVSGHSATYWINLFTAGEISYLLHNSQLSLTDIAGRFGFSSMSYFSRYVLRTLKKTPTELQKGL